MDKRFYEKTRYQNIKRNKKHKNLIIDVSYPYKTSISEYNGEKIYDIEVAISIRDSHSIKSNKTKIKVTCNDFYILWDKYIQDCTLVKKLSYNTLISKSKAFNKYLKDKITKKLSKLDKLFWLNFIENCKCSKKQKNNLIKIVRAFYNWAKENNYLKENPLDKVNKYTVPKNEMKYWTPDELKSFLDCLLEDMKSKNIVVRKKAYMIYILSLIGFNLGDRIGETRALLFGCMDSIHDTIEINHSINYDRNSKDFLGNTKNYHSQRTVDVSHKFIIEIEKYKKFLNNELELEINDNTPIFFNHSTQKPYSDTMLRKHFTSYCKKAGVKVIRMYDLRHTYVATMMAENRELYQISSRIGHSSFATTINKYGHLSTETRKEIAKTTDKYF